MADLEHLHNNSLNNSTSKQQYTFSKGSRFRERMKTEGTDRYYEVPSTKNKIAFSFGKMVKCQLNKHVKGNQSPPPGTYDVEGEVEKILKKKEGIKLMYGREQCKSSSIFKFSDTPGPGSYDPNPEFIQSKLSRDLTMGKLHTSKRLRTEDPIPGPGAYAVPSLILNENKILSKDSKRCVGKLFFYESKSSRIKRIQTEVSPQMRLPEINFKGEKTFRNDKGYTLSKSSRFNIKVLSDAPGPGTQYIKFYESSKFSEFLSNLKK